MLGFRKFVAYLLSLALVFVLIGTAWSASLDFAFSQPAHTEQWLRDSKLYDHFVDTLTQEAQQAASNGRPGPNEPSLSDPAIRTAAKTTFTPHLLEQSVAAFLNGNYDWLSGKTASPTFSVDLTGAKESFIQQVGTNITRRLSTLPRCTAAQQAQLSGNNFDALQAVCLPKGVTPQAGALTVQQQLADGNFLSTPKITQDTVGVGGNGHPYYQVLSFLPTAYKLAVSLPFVLGGLSLLLMLAILFVSLSKRRGMRKIGLSLLIAGIVVLAIVFASRFVTDKVDAHLFNNASVGPLQLGLTDFVHRVVAYLAKIDLIFGACFVVIGLVAYGLLRWSHPGHHSKPATTTPAEPVPAPGPAPELAPSPSTEPVNESAAAGAPPLPSRLPKPKKRPRLIQ